MNVFSASPSPCVSVYVYVCFVCPIIYLTSGKFYPSHFLSQSILRGCIVFLKRWNWIDEKKSKRICLVSAEIGNVNICISFDVVQNTDGVPGHLFEKKGKEKCYRYIFHVDVFISLCFFFLHADNWFQFVYLFLRFIRVYCVLFRFFSRYTDQ